VAGECASIYKQQTVVIGLVLIVFAAVLDDAAIVFIVSVVVTVVS
jgi:hypothetical protein